MSSFTARRVRAGEEINPIIDNFIGGYSRQGSQIIVSAVDVQNEQVAVDRIVFDASRVSSAYGASNTVQPSALCSLVLIRAY